MKENIKVFDIQDAGRAMELNLDDLVEIPKPPVKEFRPAPPEPATERVIYLNWKAQNERKTTQL